MISPVKRENRFTILPPNEGERLKAVIADLGDALRPLPEAACRTVTFFGRGSEFAGHATLDRKLVVTSCLCDPHSPWRKGGSRTLTVASVTSWNDPRRLDRLRFGMRRPRGP